MIVRVLHKVRTMPGESPGKPFDNALLVNHCAEREPRSAKASAKIEHAHIVNNACVDGRAVRNGSARPGQKKNI